MVLLLGVFLFFVIDFDSFVVFVRSAFWMAVNGDVWLLNWLQIECVELKGRPLFDQARVGLFLLS